MITPEELTDEEIYETFCLRIRSKRMSKKISQEHMAEALGMSRTNYVNLEAGRQNIALSTAYRICMILKMKVFE